jgi:uncharacterized cupin superfamily protein
MPTDAHKPISSNDVPWEEWSDIPCFTTRYRHLTRAAVGSDYHVGVAIEELGPGRQSSPAHYHLFEEEHVFILEGTVTTRLGADTFEMTAGDYVCYPAGQKAGHCLVNTGDAVCRYVVVGERNPNEVCVYTDTSKVLVRALGRRAIFDMTATRNYWDGEDTGLPPGVAPPPDAVVAETPVVPKPPISEASVGWHEDGVPGSARFGGRSKHLTHAAVGPGYRVGVLIESPAPGKRLCPTHYHMLEEEHALVLEGQVTLILGDERHELTAGDYVCFPAGRKVGHSFVNSGPGPCRTLMIGEHNPNEVCVYPDSNKMAVGALRMRDDIFDMSGTRQYWDGEDMA